MTLDYTWILVALSLIGNVFVVKKNAVGQWLWAGANLGWVIHNVSIGEYPQAFLFTVFFGMCIWGIVSWSRQEVLTSS